MNSRISPGTRLGRYEIRSQLGAGGMGEVYLAQDSRLDRKVALKILPATVASDTQRMRRFVQEAKTASALNHPNIITIYEIDQIDSIHFIATEFIDGETLREQLRNAPMRLGKMLDVAVQIASALAAAHFAGIVHRDIKPENIMLRHDAIVKVLDFGLAKLTERVLPDAVDSEAPTRAAFNTDPGMVLGTAVYMSPEQARGMVLDARTDIFSLGVLIYEMVAGRLPFDGSNNQEVLASVLSDKEPLPLARYARDVPIELERIVAKLLRKDRDERYQTIKDLLLDLRSLNQELEFKRKLERSTPPQPKSEANTQSQIEANTSRETSVQQTVSDGRQTSPIRLNRQSLLMAVSALLIIASVAAAYFYSTRAPSAPIISIAVLPFVNASGNSDAEYLSDGMAESLINSLSQLPNLSVKARSIVFRYKGKDLEPQRIGSELSVQAVLTGRVIEHDDLLTVSLELVDVQTGNQLWGEQYNRELTALVALQKEIALDVSNKLRMRLSGVEEQRLAKNYTENAEAYQSYLKGRFHLNKRTPEDYRKAIEYFNQAIAGDPNYALAYAGVADAYNSVPSWGYISPKQAIPQAKAAAQRALEIDSTLGEAHSALATSLAAYDWNWVEAEREFKRALELNPKYAIAHWYYGQMCLLPTGRVDEAITEIKRSLELDPLALIVNANLGAAYVYARQYDRALEQNRKTYDLEPNFIGGQFWLIEAYIANGMNTEAIALSQKALQTDPPNPIFLGPLGYAYAKAGRRREATEIVNKLEDMSKKQYVIAYRNARIYTALGQRDQAFAVLERAYENRDWFLPRLKVDPAFDSLHDDPRYQDILRRIGLER